MGVSVVAVRPYLLLPAVTLAVGMSLGVAACSAQGATPQPKAGPFATDPSTLAGSGRQPDGSHKVLLIETSEVTEDGMIPPFSLHVDRFGRRRRLYYHRARKVLTLNTPDAKLFGPQFIKDGKIAEGLRVVVMRRVETKGGLARIFHQ